MDDQKQQDPVAPLRLTEYLPEPTSEPSPDRAGAAGTERFCILLAEDDRDLLFVMSAVLEANGFDVHACVDGREAGLAFTARKRVDLVLCDVQMNFFSGIEVAQAIVGIDPEVPIVLLSGRGLSLGDERTITTRGWHLLLKPFSTEKLLSTIRKYLPNPRI